MIAIILKNKIYCYLNLFNAKIKYKFVGECMGKYDNFAEIKIEESELLLNSGKDIVYNRLKLNGIITLKDLFEKYDQHMICLGKFADSYYRFQEESVRGRIELLRYKYLDTNLSFDNILNETIFSTSGLYPEEYCKVNRTNYFYLRKLGFTHQMTDWILFDLKSDEVLIELIKRKYKDIKKYNSSKKWQQLYANILKIIVDYYDKMINIVQNEDIVKQYSKK